MKLYDNSCPRVPSGIPLNEGLLYFETQTREMCVYSNSRWKTRLDFIVFSHHLKKDPKKPENPGFWGFFTFYHPDLSSAFMGQSGY